jgi:hypothetical protein
MRAMSNPKEHDYIEKCPFCGKFMTFEQVKQHKCEAQITQIKEIPVLYCYQLTDDNGKKTVIAHGFNGILYRLIECENPSSRRKVTDYRADEDETDP